MPKSFSTAEKIYQDMLLLTANKDFMRDVEKIRKKCKEVGAIAVKDQYENHKRGQVPFLGLPLGVKVETSPSCSAVFLIQLSFP